jgi:hypothetical protein
LPNNKKKKKMEVNFPPVPNVEEVRFGTPLNQKFGKNIVEKELQVAGGYKPGSELSRDLIAYSNVYWAKKLSSSFGRPTAVVTAERVNYSICKKMGNFISKTGFISSFKCNDGSKDGKSNNEGIICINPGGEETWERLITKFGCNNSPFLVLNNAYSTSYDLGNTKGFEEVYYLKRISKGWLFRSFPGKWQAYIERPDGSCELLQEFDYKPTLRDASKLVREESFKRYAIFNDRWSQGFGGRL